MTRYNTGSVSIFCAVQGSLTALQGCRYRLRWRLLLPRRWRIRLYEAEYTRVISFEFIKEGLADKKMRTYISDEDVETVKREMYSCSFLHLIISDRLYLSGKPPSRNDLIHMGLVGLDATE